MFEQNIEDLTLSDDTNRSGKKQCTNCKCWRIFSDFIGVKGTELKRCLKCRVKDDKQKKRPDVQEKRNERQKEKKYYQVFREKKREENESEFKKHNADIMKAWRDNNKEHLTHWRQQNFNYKLKGIKQQSRVKGINWSDEMSDEYCKGLMASNCFYCKQNDPKCVNGIDRMDSRKGYEKDNCVSCCKHCNFIKKSLDAKTFVERCIHITSCQLAGDTFYYNAWQPSNRSSFKQYKYRASKKNLAFELDNEIFDQICSGKCHYCHRESKALHINGIDRIDNSKGYILGNVVTCCTECNTMKTDMGIEIFLETCKTVSDNSKNIIIPDMPRCYHAIATRSKST